MVAYISSNQFVNTAYDAAKSVGRTAYDVVDFIASPTFLAEVGGIVVASVIKEVIPINGLLSDIVAKTIAKFAKQFFKKVMPEFTNLKNDKRAFLDLSFRAVAYATALTCCVLALKIVVEVSSRTIFDPGVNSPYPAMTILSISFFFWTMHYTKNKSDPAKPTS